VEGAKERRLFYCGLIKNGKTAHKANASLAGRSESKQLLGTLVQSFHHYLETKAREILPGLGFMQPVKGLRACIVCVFIPLHGNGALNFGETFSFVHAHNSRLHFPSVGLSTNGSHKKCSSINTAASPEREILKIANGERISLLFFSIQGFGNE
jgi:hypothetical protein